MGALPFLEQNTDGLLLRIHVKTNQRKQRLFFSQGDNYLTIQVKAPPEKGKANRELIKLLAKTLSIPTTALSIVSGISSKDKLVALSRVSAEQIAKELLAFQQ